MKALLVCIAVAVVIAVGYPLVNEDTTSTCSALERRLITVSSTDKRDLPALLALGALQRSVSDGAFATALVKQQSPNVPASVSCTVTYWRVLVDPRQAQAIIQGGTRGSFKVPQVVSPSAEAEKAMRALSNLSAPPTTPYHFNPPK
jgi:hypothetical protein